MVYGLQKKVIRKSELEEKTYFLCSKNSNETLFSVLVYTYMMDIGLVPGLYSREEKEKYFFYLFSQPQL